MSHTDIIWILVTASFASTFGVYVVIRKTIHYTRPPVNTLVRRGDIELGDYIEPTRPQPVFNLTENQFPTNYYERVPTYYSGNPPSYQTVDRFNINCCLENENIINLDLWLILFLLVLIIIIIISIRKSSLWIMTRDRR